VCGWLRVRSFTRPPAALLEHSRLYLQAAGGERECRVLQSKPAGGGFALRVAGLDSRAAAEGWRGAAVAVARSDLPPPGEDEYYWVDLLGMRVENAQGVPLGTVERLLETGANDVLVVTGGDCERLIPFVPGYYVLRVVLEARRLVVDWHPDD